MAKNFRIMITKVKFIWGILIIVIVLFLSYLSFFQWRGNNLFYQKKLSNTVDEVRITTKGCFELRFDTLWFDIGIYSGYIDSIQKGDSIFKEPKSYKIVVKRKNENFKAYEYHCAY
jgi:hypothetical protein